MLPIVLAREFGAGLTFAEMVSDKGLLHGNKKTKALLVNFPNEHPYAQQIWGGDRIIIKSCSLC